MMETVGQRLKRLRLERKLSQRDLAVPGVSYAYISRIEAGTRTPSVKALRRLARALGVSVAYLETGSEVTETDEVLARVAGEIGDELEVVVGNEGVVISCADEDGALSFTGSSLTDALRQADRYFVELRRLAEERARIEAKQEALRQAAATAA